MMERTDKQLTEEEEKALLTMSVEEVCRRLLTIKPGGRNMPNKELRFVNFFNLLIILDMCPDMLQITHGMWDRFLGVWASCVKLLYATISHKRPLSTGPRGVVYERVNCI